MQQKQASEDSTWANIKCLGTHEGYPISSSPSTCEALDCALKANGSASEAVLQVQEVH